MSLRFRLTAISVLLVALGLLGAGIATRHYLDSFLVDRVDQQFAAAQLPSLAALVERRSRVGRAASPNALPSGSYVALVTPGDGVVRTRYVGTRNARGTRLPGLGAIAASRPSTTTGWSRWTPHRSRPRVGRGRPYTLVIAIPLDDVHSTVSPADA